jgi:hypothetical protein
MMPTAEDRLRQIIGQLVLDKCVLEAEVAKLKAEVAKLTPPHPTG